MSDALSTEELKRYRRHLDLPEVGMEGQLRLRSARVLMIGAGGLGSPLGMYLAAAGVGTLGIVDADVVELSNLQRQIMHGDSDIGRPKVTSAAESLREINPHLKLETHEVFFDEHNAMALVQAYDIVVDGTDNFTTRYLANDACVLAGKPNVYGSIYRFEGQASLFDATRGPCYRCLYPSPPPSGAIPNCAEGGVLGMLPGLIGSIQATETVKQLLDIGESLLGRLLLFDALAMSFREMRLHKDPDCPICGEQPSITTLRPEATTCASPPPESDTNAMNVQELQQALQGATPPLLLDVREDHERAVGAITPSLHIPLSEIPNRYSELDAGTACVVYCKGGVRSANVIAFLGQHGFANLQNLDGGILAWQQQIDSSVEVL